MKRSAIQKLRKGLILVMLPAATLFFTSCGGGDDDAKKPKGDDSAAVETPNDAALLKKMTEHDLSEYELPMTIMLPTVMGMDGQPVPLDMRHEPAGFKWEIVLGENYHLVINDMGEEAVSIVELKADQGESLVFDHTYIEEGEDFVLYSQNISEDKAGPGFKPLHHMAVVKSMDGINYDIKSHDQGIYSDKMARKMLVSARSMKKKGA